MAKQRAELGWTQTQLAERIGVSRVALSHIEANLSVPSERTVALLASVFRLEPHELVDGTNYPPAKADRLPLVVARYTEVDHQLAVLAAVLNLVDPLPVSVSEEWRTRLTQLLHSTLDNDERMRVRSALRSLTHG